MSEPGPEPTVVLTGAARAAKAGLGPTAWAVLEELTLGAERGEDGRLVATTSVRRLGTALGLDKDTVARALVRLAAAGFVLRCSTERPADGSHYVVTPISGLTRLGAADPVATSTVVRPSNGDRPGRPEVGDGARRRRLRRAPVADDSPVSRAAQLSLLGEDAAPEDDTTTTSSTTAPTPTSTQHRTPLDQLDTEPDDDHHHRYAISPIRTPDSCHPSGEADAAGLGGSGGGGADPC